MLLLRKLLEYQFPCYQGKVRLVSCMWAKSGCQITCRYLLASLIQQSSRKLSMDILACPDHSETFTHEMHSISLNVPPHMNCISQTHCHPKTKIGTQGEDLSNSQKKVEKIPNIYISVIKGQRSVPMTFDLQFNPTVDHIYQ